MLPAATEETAWKNFQRTGIEVAFERLVDSVNPMHNIS